MRALSIGSLTIIMLAFGLADARAQAADAVPQIRIDREVGAARQMALEAGQNRLLILSEEIGRIAVANPDVADLRVITPIQVLLTAKGVGSTDLTLWNRNNVPLVIALGVTRNLDALRGQVKELFPKENVSVTSVGDLVVLSGQVTDVRLPERIAEVARLHADKVANLVQVAGVQQVQLEVRFAELARSGLREIGVNFFHQDENGRRAGGVTNNRSAPGAFLTVPGTTALNGRPPLIPVPGFDNAFTLFLSEGGEFPFSVTLDLLEQNSLAKVLAEPTLVAMSGQQARFLAGGELPVPLSSTLGQVSVDWKKFGIQLDFTPTVIGDSIHLTLRTEVSDIDSTIGITVGGSFIPGLTSRQSETTIRLGDGQAFAVAGLLSDRVRSAVAQLPVLGSIPILGALFRSSDYQRQETELLVIVTARLVRPVAPHELPPLPTDYEATDPSNFAFFLMGSDSQAARPTETKNRGPTGERGFSH
jgi:pilus assembly protein CpaC